MVIVGLLERQGGYPGSMAFLPPAAFFDHEGGFQVQDSAARRLLVEELRHDSTTTQHRVGCRLHNDLAILAGVFYPSICIVRMSPSANSACQLGLNRYVSHQEVLLLIIECKFLARQNI